MAPHFQDDVSMDDVAAATPQVDDVDDSLMVHDTDQRIRILPGSQIDAASFEFKKEDHTLGNALRWIIMKNPAVEFCGYSIPHPSEDVMNVRIQVHPGSSTAVDALEKGFKDLIDLCDVVTKKFTEAKEEHQDKMQS